MDKLLEVKDLKTYFVLDEGVVKAVDGISFDVEPGKTLGIVGESGCGKSVTALSILKLTGPRSKIQGEILFHKDGEVIDITKLDPKGDEIRNIRGKEIAMIFQEPGASFSPVHTVGEQIMEAVILHQNLDKKKAREVVIELMRIAGIPRPELRIDEYPHQFSGGMLQRAMIAMALSCRPQLLIADEPTTSLDVTIQAQILELMKELQKQFGMAVMMITHNLGVVAEMAEDVVVMYLGKIVESASVEEIFHNPSHPYTKALLESIPKIGKRVEGRLKAIKGMVPDPYNLPTGCNFHPRCPEFVRGLCDVRVPELKEIKPGHKVSCLLYGEVENHE
ncbi:MAG TPA: ABC transporter ATP-binding protein [Dictyoglomaceae bacterium]|nr:ABC transporter ATP-binding protein [Dictyoglomaceae bacterium]HOL39340.1 ABC transporter ATP-binding protein [Dictyoglomaceae bacterium]HPP15978.1 ABC transporter ATP-binding protein [Dictyoglomaceae bacterium]